MLGVHRLTSQGADYYLADLAQELPLPTGGWDGRAEWTGTASERLSLRGPIDPDDFRSVLGGRHPVTGHPLRSERATVLGYDLNFSPPKSVSLLFALGGEEVAQEVVAAHKAAVGGALSYVEAHSLSAQRGSGEERNLVATTGLVAATFTHGVNRNLDPHLHSHVVMANLVHGLDGRWGACDQRGLSVHRDAADAVYGAHLRTELSNRLDVHWAAEPGRHAEVLGMSPLLIGEFSSRSADIRRHMGTWGSHSARGAHVAWAATRSPKQPAPSCDYLSAQWARRARAIDGEARVREPAGSNSTQGAEPDPRRAPVRRCLVAQPRSGCSPPRCRGRFWRGCGGRGADGAAPGADRSVGTHHDAGDPSRRGRRCSPASHCVPGVPPPARTRAAANRSRGARGLAQRSSQYRCVSEPLGRGQR